MAERNPEHMKNSVVRNILEHSNFEEFTDADENLQERINKFRIKVQQFVASVVFECKNRRKPGMIGWKNLLKTLPL